MEYTHKPKYIAAMVTADVIFVVAMVLHGLTFGGVSAGVSTNLTTGAVASIDDADFAPAQWAVFVFGVTCAWQAAWLLYGISTIWRRSSYGYLYLAPGHMHPSLYLLFAAGTAAGAGRMLLWERREAGWALGALVAEAGCLYACLAVSWLRLHARGGVLGREGYGHEVWLVRGLVQNGLALQAAWTTVLSLAALRVVLLHVAGAPPHVADVVTLTLLMLAITCWFFLDTLLLDVYTRYTLTPYPLFVVATAGRLADDWDGDVDDSVLGTLALAAACLAAILKVVVLVVRHVRRQSIFRNVSFFSSQSVYGSTSRDNAVFYDNKDFT